MRFRTFAALAALVIGCGPAAAQWTNLPPGPNARIVYVSSSTGADGNSGLSPTTPKATLAAGFALLRNGQGDHLWLRRGDTFALTSTLLWTKSGASAVEPMVLGTYGTGARPIIDPGGGEAIHITPGFQSANTVRHVAVIGIHFRSAARDFTQPNFDLATVTPSAVAIRVVGVQTTAPQIVENLLIEDCKFEYLGQPLIVEGPYVDSVRDVRVRRSVLADTYATNGHTNGIYVSYVRGFLLEDTLIDGVQRAPGLDPSLVTSSLSHTVYVQSTARDVTLRHNLLTRAFDGSMMRSGGVYEHNLVADVNIGNHQGYMFSASAPIITEGVDSRVLGNVFLKVGGNLGIQAGNLRSGTFRDNVFLSSATTGGTAISLIGSTALSQVGVHGLLITSNFAVGLRGLSAYGDSIDGVSVFQNQFRAPNTTVVQLLDHQRANYSFAANTYRSDAVSTRWFSVNGTFHDLAGWSAAVGEMKPFQGLPIDPATTPDIEAYHASIGGTPSFTAFLDQARQQSRQNWRVAYTAGRVIDFVRQRIGLELIAFTPGLDVRLTTSQFAPGTQMVVTAVLSGGTPSTVVDAYIVVRLPDGQMLSLQPGGSIVAGLVPIARGVTPFDFTTEVFRYLFNGNEPPGVYTWMAALATQGTLHLVSPIAQFSFVVR